MNITLIYIPFPNSEVAQVICKKLLKKQLIACANIINNIDSMYLWNDEIQVESEVVAIIKTKTECLKKVTDLVMKNHPYEIPAIIKWDADSENKSYSNWLEQSLNLT
jgi:uncharacterized protein involved in tolerance to divalent cations